MQRFAPSLVGLIAVLFCLILIQPISADIVSDATGTIDLELKPYWETWLGEPVPSQVVSVPIGLDNVSASIDGAGYYSAGGLCQVDYQYTRIGKSRARFDFYTYADSDSIDDGNGGSAGVQLDITFAEPVYFRFEADVLDAPVNYEVSFNGVSAYAHYDSYFGGFYGTFPLLYYDEPGHETYAYGWDTYVHEGVLPAGTYHLTTEALAAIHGRYGVGLDSEGSASLYVQMLGDVNGNGRVGNEDLKLVLSHWGKKPNKHGKLQGDANGDGAVDQTDLDLVMLGLNGIPSPVAVVVNIPEPATAGWLLVSSLLLVRRRSLTRLN